MHPTCEHPNQLIISVQEVVDSNTIILGNFNTPLTSMDRLSKQKINKETMSHNDTLDQMDLTDLFRTFHPYTAEYTFFFSSASRTFCRLDSHVRPQNKSQQMKRIKVIPCNFSNCNAMKLEINHRRHVERTQI